MRRKHKERLELEALLKDHRLSADTSREGQLLYRYECASERLMLRYVHELKQRHADPEFSGPLPRGMYFGAPGHWTDPLHQQTDSADENDEARLGDLCGDVHGVDAEDMPATAEEAAERDEATIETNSRPRRNEADEVSAPEVSVLRNEPNVVSAAAASVSRNERNELAGTATSDLRNEPNNVAAPAASVLRNEPNNVAAPAARVLRNEPNNVAAPAARVLRNEPNNVAAPAARVLRNEPNEPAAEEASALRNGPNALVAAAFGISRRDFGHGDAVAESRRKRKLRERNQRKAERAARARAAARAM